MSAEAQVREKYATLISQHSAVVALQLRKQPKPKARPGVPELLQGALDDTNVNTAVTRWQRVMSYHEGVSDLNRRRIKGEKMSFNNELALIRQGENIERDFHEGVIAAFKAIRANRVIRPFATAVMESVPARDLPILVHPSALSENEVAALSYLGTNPKHYKRFYKHYTESEHFDVQRHQEVLRLLASNKKDATLKKAESKIKQTPFPESPRYLVKQNIITLGGDGNPTDLGGTSVCGGGAAVGSASLAGGMSSSDPEPGPWGIIGVVVALAVVAVVAIFDLW